MRRSLLVGFLLCCFGCGKGDGLGRASVTGKVTLDGAPIAAGSITFYPTGGAKGPAAGGTIEDGQYLIAVAQGPIVGRNRVEIRATRKTGRKVQAPLSDRDVLTDEIVEAVPACYNAQSTLTADIASGKNVMDYPLTSK